MVALAVAVGLLLAAAPEDARDRAREAFAQGQSLYRAGDYARALAAFQEADIFSPSPAAAYNIGRCHERLGQTAAAVAAYERYLLEAPAAPDHDAVAGRVAELRRQLPQEGRLRVAVDPPGAMVAVDRGASEPAPVEKLLRPGRHAVHAELSGHTPADREVELGSGGSVLLELTLRPLEPEPDAPRVPDAAVREQVPPAAPRSVPGERRWTYVALTVAVLCLGTALAFGGSAQSAENQLHARVHTQVDAQQLYDSANARAIAANSFYAAAAVTGAAAITLFFLEPELGRSP